MINDIVREITKLLMWNICLLLMVIIPRIIKSKADPAPEHQNIDTCGLEEIKLCEFFSSVLGEDRCLVLLYTTLETTKSTGIPKEGDVWCIFHTLSTTNHKDVKGLLECVCVNEKSSRMCMREINKDCFKIES
jgi:hypothetical protein